MLGIPVITPENIRAWKLSSDLDNSRMFERTNDSLTEIYSTQKNKKLSHQAKKRRGLILLLLVLNQVPFPTLSENIDHSIHYCSYSEY